MPPRNIKHPLNGLNMRTILNLCCWGCWRLEEINYLNWTTCSASSKYHCDNIPLWGNSFLDVPGHGLEYYDVYSFSVLKSTKKNPDRGLVVKWYHGEKGPCHKIGPTAFHGPDPGVWPASLEAQLQRDQTQIHHSWPENDEGSSSTVAEIKPAAQGSHPYITSLFGHNTICGVEPHSRVKNPKQTWQSRTPACSRDFIHVYKYINTWIFR